MKKSFWCVILLGLVLLFSIILTGCWGEQAASDKQQTASQEQIAQESNAQVGMPNIVNFREKKILKDIYELRDQADLLTYSYIFVPMTGKFTFIGPTIGYPIPYATQYTNPEKVAFSGHYESATIPQMDPNGLFTPQSAMATWVLIKNPAPSTDITPFYCEENVETFQFKLPITMLNNPDSYTAWGL